MQLTTILLSLFSSLVLAHPHAHVSVSRSPSNPTPYPPESIEQFSFGESSGLTTSPQIQNYHADSTIRLTFAQFDDDPTLLCRLELDLNGKNSQGSWAAWLPDSTASVSVSPVSNGQVAADPVMHMNLATTDFGSGLNVTFEPESVLCSQLSLVELAGEGKNTLILGWQQDLSLPEGIKLVAGV